MEPKLLHSFQVTPKKAIEIQEELKSKVIRSGFLKDLKIVAGIDVAYNKSEKIGFAAVIVMEYPTHQVIEQVTSSAITEFPYVPGLLTFREAPPILAALKKLQNSPELLIFDGQGIAHPRGLGLASHLGILYDIPAIGVAKKKLFGEYREPGEKKGNSSFLYHKGEIIGLVYRSRTSVKPIFISIGHRVSLEFATEVISSLTTKYRLPEPTRLAHQLVTKTSKEFNS